MSADTNLMPIAGAIDPVPVARAVRPRADGKVDLVGLRKEQIRAELEAAGLDSKQAKLRSKQLWHWIYNRGVTDFANMSDVAKAQRGWFAERFVVSRPEVVEAQVSSDGTRKWLLKTHTATISRWCSSRTPTAAPCACRAKSAARSIAVSATPGRCSWSAISSRRKSSGR